MDRFAQTAIEPRKILDLVKADNFNVIADILKDAQPPAGSTPDLFAALLAAAYLVCQGSIQVRDEIEWYHQAEHKADERASEYKRLLTEILQTLIDLKRSQMQQPSNPLNGLESSSAIAPIDQVRASKRISSLLDSLRHLLTNGSVQPATQIAAIEVASASTQVWSALVTGELSRFVIYCLEPFKIYRDQQLVKNWSGVKALSVFKYLLLHRESSVPKDRLMDIFWPDAKPDAARRNLHQAIYTIRRALREGASSIQSVTFENDCYFLNPDIPIWADYEEFSRRAKAGLALEKKGYLAEALVEYSIAEGLYQNDFLEEDLYEDWTDLKRQELRDTFLELADRLSEHYLHQTEYTATMALCHKIIRIDRCQESAYRRLMKCYLAQGQRHFAIRQYLTCLDVLKEDLNLLPSEETVRLYKQLVKV